MINELGLHIATMMLVFVSFLFAFYLFTVPSKNRLGNVFLGLFFLLQGIDASSYFYDSYFEIPDLFDQLRFQVGSFVDEPLLFLFVLSVIYSDFKLSLKHLWHLVPLLIGILISYNMVWSHFSLDHLTVINRLDNNEAIINAILAAMQRVFYLLLTFYVLYRYKKVLLENYSFSDQSNYNWLMQLNIAWGLIFVVATIKNIYKLGQNPEFLVTYRFVIIIVLLIFTCWLLLKAMYAPKLFQGIDSNLQSTSTIGDASKQTISTTAPPTAADPSTQRKIKQLQDYMVSEAPYLDSKLSIDQLARQLELNPREISSLINQDIGQNFYEFVNQYRINKAKQLLEDASNNKLTILEILYQVGFHTKSSFNHTFKKQTGVTPTQYRRKYL